MKKNYAITSGNFTTRGNFTAYTALGDRLFIHKTQMAGLNLEEGKLPTFPFYCLGDTKKIGQLDLNGKAVLNPDGTELQVDRLQALSIFATKDELKQALVDNATLDIEINAAIKESATAAGLTEAQFNRMVDLA
jgi:hypothetical protein